MERRTGVSCSKRRGGREVAVAVKADPPRHPDVVYAQMRKCSGPPQTGMGEQRTNRRQRGRLRPDRPGDRKIPSIRAAAEIREANAVARIYRSRRQNRETDNRQPMRPVLGAAWIVKKSRRLPLVGVPSRFFRVPAQSARTVEPPPILVSCLPGYAMAGVFGKIESLGPALWQGGGRECR